MKISKKCSGILKVHFDPHSVSFTNTTSCAAPEGPSLITPLRRPCAQHPRYLYTLRLPWPRAPLSLPSPHDRPRACAPLHHLETAAASAPPSGASSAADKEQEANLSLPLALTRWRHGSGRHGQGARTFRFNPRAKDYGCERKRENLRLEILPALEIPAALEIHTALEIHADELNLERVERGQQGTCGGAPHARQNSRPCRDLFRCGPADVKKGCPSFISSS
ncbi:hypothetical protein DFH07DRAFT_776998 [Mycena maculata]|uniref:Uncharacterized protein n=1 Tax=Mycena maculata TaxID=230809 RepID=A0AAD7N3H8_9AGAR|nr:hypothetical protein DFH07DRAFT_776998 [Mycena maculata]